MSDYNSKDEFEDVIKRVVEEAQHMYPHVGFSYFSNIYAHSYDIRFFFKNLGKYYNLAISREAKDVSYVRDELLNRIERTIRQVYEKFYNEDSNFKSVLNERMAALGTPINREYSTWDGTTVSYGRSLASQTMWGAYRGASVPSQHFIIDPPAEKKIEKKKVSYEIGSMQVRGIYTSGDSYKLKIESLEDLGETVNLKNPSLLHVGKRRTLKYNYDIKKLKKDLLEVEKGNKKLEELKEFNYKTLDTTYDYEHKRKK